MGYFAGLDVSLEETAICIVDDAGHIVREARAASEPEALIAFFERCGMSDGAGWPGGVLADGLAACGADGGRPRRRSASRPAKPRRRWARCRTRPTATTRAGSRRSCAPAGIARCMSKARPAAHGARC